MVMSERILERSVSERVATAAWNCAWVIVRRLPEDEEEEEEEDEALEGVAVPLTEPFAVNGLAISMSPETVEDDDEE
jgi:hypothetical protein